MKKPLVSIIVVNWNGGDIYRNTLLSISKIVYPRWELIIVDNGSTDGSNIYHKSVNFGRVSVEFIQNDFNAGFAPANNQGYLRSKGKYILLLNNDTRVPSNFLEKMIDKMESDKSIGAMQPKIFLMDKEQYLDNAGSYMTPTGFLSHWGFMEKDSDEFNSEKEIFSAKGACLLTRRQIIETVGLFDDSFKSYFEESDFCWRVWLSGSRVIYFPDTYILHKVGFTSKRMSQFQINYHSIKNRNLSLFKNLSSVNLFRILIIHLILIKGLGLYYLFKLQFSKAWMVFKALGWNIINLPLALKKRSETQKLRKVTDNQIFSRVSKNVNIVDMFKHFKRVEENFNEK